MMKKAQPRRQRVPKRGPGVAELEKILKEQESHDLSMNELRDLSPPPFLFPLPNNNTSLCHQPHSQSLNPPRPPPPPLPPPLPVPVFPADMVLPWTPHAPLLRNLDHVFSTPPNSSGCRGDGGPLLEKALFPTTLVEEGRKSDTPMTFSSHNTWPSSSSSPLLLRENNSEYFDFPSTVNYIPGSAPSSASVSASSSSAAAARQFHQIEHPSSQRSTSYNCIPTLPEEEKMVSGKRLRPFSVESHSHRDPNFHSKVPMFTNMAVKESPSSSSSSLEMNHSAANLDRILRDAKRGFPRELMSSCSTKSSGSKGYQQAEDSNFMALGSVAIPSSTRHEVAATFNFLLSQENTEESQSQQRVRAGRASGSDYTKITFNSLCESNSNSKGSKETAIGSYKKAAESEAKAEAEGDDIDLNLKL